MEKTETDQKGLCIGEDGQTRRPNPPPTHVSAAFCRVDYGVLHSPSYNTANSIRRTEMPDLTDVGSTDRHWLAVELAPGSPVCHVNVYNLTSVRSNLAKGSITTLRDGE